MPKSVIWTSPAFDEEHVRRLEIAVNHAVLVRALEAEQDLADDVARERKG
jgi:hypothetical protein